MTQWIRHYWAEDDTVSYFEMDDEGRAVRQVGLQSAEQRPVVAAKLSEVLRIRDHGTIADMQAYEHRYGVLAEDDLHGWREDNNIVVISEAEFEQAWGRARQVLDHLP